jgi:hypothetical protein
MSSHRPRERPEHQEFSELLPWYVNGTIAEQDRLKLESHLEACAVCRADLLVERRIHRSMSAESAIEYVPAASLKRLHARLDDLDDAAESPSGAPSATRPQPERRSMPPRRWMAAMPQRGWVAASVAAAAVTLSLLAADRWRQSHSTVSTPAGYYTVTTPEPRAKDEIIRAVFSPAITLVELQAILGEAQLRIVAGPTEAGVYSLATSSSRPVSLSLALLRQHAAVRFAEITQVSPAPSPSAGVPP